MNPSLKKISLILLTIIASMVFPYVGLLIAKNGDVPHDFFSFPPQLDPLQIKEPFSWPVFIAIASVCLAIVLFYFFPNIFGFKKVKVESHLKKIKKGSYPVWFWFGCLLMFGAMIILWGKFSEPKFLTNWALVPLFWGAIIFFDGIVFRRTNGHSIIKDRPHTLIAMAICSIGGWAYFEYINYYVNENWYYPFGDMISKEHFVIYSLLGSSALLTIAFELYMLLKTFPGLAVKYTKGPRITVNKFTWKVLLISSLLVMVLISVFPDELFFAIWLAPLILFMSMLELLDIWTPFTPIKKGNWAPFALMCLTYFIQGVFHEGWNYFSAEHLAGNQLETYNPAFWVYSIPYVEAFKVFEMPVLGYFGYLPFGLYCWVVWIVYAYINGINPEFEEPLYDLHIDKRNTVSNYSGTSSKKKIEFEQN